MFILFLLLSFISLSTQSGNFWIHRRRIGHMYKHFKLKKLYLLNTENFSVTDSWNFVYCCGTVYPRRNGALFASYIEKKCSVSLERYN
jgi:hypothetical protein